MFSKDELLVIKDALKIADEKYMRDLEKSQNNQKNMVSNNRKQKKLWLVQNKVKKLIVLQRIAEVRSYLIYRRLYILCRGLPEEVPEPFF